MSENAKTELNPVCDILGNSDNLLSSIELELLHLKENVNLIKESNIDIQVTKNEYGHLKEQTTTVVDTLHLQKLRMENILIALRGFNNHICKTLFGLEQTDKEEKSSETKERSIPEYEKTGSIPEYEKADYEYHSINRLVE